MTSDWKMHSISSDFIWKYTIATLPVAQHSKYWCWSPKTQRVYPSLTYVEASVHVHTCNRSLVNYSVRLSLCILLVLASDSGIAACQWHHDIHCQHSFQFPQYRNPFKWISCLCESVCCAYSGNRALFKISI